MSTVHSPIIDGGLGEEVLRRTVLVKVRLGRPGVRRRIDRRTVRSLVQEPTTDIAMLYVAKDLLDSPELDAVARYDAEIRRYLTSRCLPSFFEGGKYLVPIADLEEIDRRLEYMQGRRAQLVEHFLAAYGQRVEEARGRLGVLFRPDDYPSEESIRQMFAFEIAYLAFSVPEVLHQISHAIYQRERQRIAQQIESVGEECRAYLRAGFAELVAHMLDRLTPDVEGKPKIFHRTSVERLLDFLRTFSSRNVTDDRELEALVTQARSLLAGVSVDVMRDNSVVREQIRQGFEQIKAGLDPLVTDAPIRRFDFPREMR